MNRAKWLQVKSANRLLAKLMEEVGEVAKAKGDVSEVLNQEERDEYMRHMIKEIDHVTFIAGCLRDVVYNAQSEGMAL